MNFRRRLTILLPLTVVAALALALMAVPASAINQASMPGGGTVLNNPGPFPEMINYQGYLTDDGGNPVNDTLEMTFSIYETEEATTPIWTETQLVTVTDGIFNVLLGSINPIGAKPLTGETYLGIQVGADKEMAPRQPMVSVAYAIRADMANDADALDGMDSSAFAPVSHNHDAAYVNVTGDTMTGKLVLPSNGLAAGTDQLVLTGGKVGIGTTSPGSCKLNVQGGSNTAIYGESSSAYGVIGVNSSSGNYGQVGNPAAGMYGQSSSGNYGQLGTSNEGVYGYNNSSGNYGQLGTSSYGVYGNGGSYGMYGSSSSGYGVFGQSSSGTGMYGTGGNTGVYGLNSSTGNHGHLGTSTEGAYGQHLGSGNYGQLGTSNYGVLGYSSNGEGTRGESSSGTGVVGYSSSSIGVSGSSGGSSAGVQGISNTGSGVYGRNSSTGNYGQLGTGGYGVYGTGNSAGVYGYSGSNYGVYGYGYSYGTYGYAFSSSGYGVYGLGTYGVYGNGYTSGVYGSGIYGVYGNGSNTGVYGSGNYVGVHGYNSADWGAGVYGEVTSQVNAYGVYGSGPLGSYDFYAGGAGHDYGPFTGTHEVKLASSFPQDFRMGLIVSVTGEAQVRTEEGEIDYSSTLPTVQLADTANDIKVAGVLTSESPLPKDHWYQAAEGERFGVVNALGDGRVWVTNINGDIAAGNYITTSAIAGYGQKQDDDFLHSYTLGKATENVNWSQVTETVEFNGQTYKAYPIAVFYTSG